MAAKSTSKTTTASSKGKTGKRPRRTPEEKLELYDAVQEAMEDGRTQQSVFDTYADRWNKDANNISQIYRTFAKKIDGGSSVSKKPAASNGKFDIGSIPFHKLSEDQLGKIKQRIREEAVRRRETLDKDFEERKKKLEALAHDL